MLEIEEGIGTLRNALDKHFGQELMSGPQRRRPTALAADSAAGAGKRCGGMWVRRGGCGGCGGWVKGGRLFGNDG